MTSSINAPQASSFSTWAWLAPSVSSIFFVSLLFCLSCGPFAVRLLGDAGIGWHIRNGELMLQSHSFTRLDPFSVTMGGHPWYAWEWLYDVLIALIHNWLGLNGVVFFTADIIAVTFSIVLRHTLRRGGGLPITFGFLILALGASSIHFLTRPHVLTWLFVAIWFHLLESDAATVDTKRFTQLYWYPLLMLLWANLHGGFLLGIALSVLYLVGNLVELVTTHELQQRFLLREKTIHYAAAILLSVGASLVNPYGYHLYTHIYGYLTNRFLMDHIDEFLSPNFHGGAQQCFAALLLIALVTLLSARKRPSYSQILVIVLAAYGGLYSSRNLPTSSILLTLIVAPLLSGTVREASVNAEIMPSLRSLFFSLSSFSDRMNAMELRSRGYLWPFVVTAFGIAICMHGGKVAKHPWVDAKFSAKRFPVEATNFVLQRGSHDPIFCPDYWGGYLIYRLYPASKVFVDDRHDLYGEKFLNDYLQVVHVGPRWNDVLDEMRVNWVMTPVQSSLGSILKEAPGWNSVYEDGTAILFERSQKLPEQ